MIAGIPIPALPPGTAKSFGIIRAMHPRIWRLILLAASISASAQTFDVASIRLSGPKSVRGSNGGPGSRDPERYVFGKANLMDFIAVGYDVDIFQISSQLTLDRDDFDLAANVPAAATKDQFRTMLRNFLNDRFHLRAHLETKRFDAFALMVAKGGAKLGNTAAAKRTSTEGFPNLPPGKPGIIALNSASGFYEVTRIRAQRQPVSRLVKMLRTDPPRPVVDVTGLPGVYDFTLEFSTELSSEVGGADVGPEAPDLATALREQLGLQLVARKLPFKVVVIDAIDRFPSEN